MTEKTTKTFEVAAYVAVIVMALTITAIEVDKYLKQLTASRGTAVHGVTKPDRLSLEGVDWNANRYTLVLALSAKCHFCEESTGFYRKLVSNEQVKDKLRIIAVFSEPTEEAEHFLNDHGISGVEIRRAMLWDLGVDGTPTLMLVDGAGKVVESWNGRLSPDQEASVMARLQSV